jgi:ATP-dependent HslUV protease ATP-binding subunit HslU
LSIVVPHCSSRCSCSGAFHDAKTSDMLAELQGRLPIRVELKGLEAADLKRILTEPKANLIEQQKQMIQADHVTLRFTPEAIDKIAEIAASINKHIENIGARRLYTVLEKIMETISFEAPEMAPGSVVTVDEKLVTDKLMPLTRKDDLSKFIL